MLKIRVGGAVLRYLEIVPPMPFQQVLIDSNDYSIGTIIAMEPIVNGIQILPYFERSVFGLVPV